MKMFLVKVIARTETAIFCVFERTLIDAPQKMYEIHLIKGRENILDDIPSICLPGSDIEDMLRHIFCNVGFKILKEAEKDDFVCKRVSYVFNRNVPAKILFDIWGLNQDNLNVLEKIDSAIKTSDDMYDRWKIEEILYKYDLYTQKQAAIILGVKDRYFDDVIELIKNTYGEKLLYSTMLPQKGDAFISTDFISKIKMLMFPEKLYETREEFLNDFEVFLKEQDRSIYIRKCFISEHLKEKNVKHPFYIDILLNMPVSSEYSIPIRNEKPGYLAPDYISWYSYLIAENEFRNANLFPLSEDVKKSFAAWKAENG